MGDPRIIDIALDERTIIWRNADIEQERRIAIFDLLEGNHFEPVSGVPGPFRLLLRVEDGRLAGQLRDVAYQLSMSGLSLEDYPAVQDWFNRIAARPGVIAGTSVQNPANLSSARPVLNEEQWSNLFGRNMLNAPAR